jgi:hypothetical protein
VYALHNAVDLPARLPDGSTTSRSVSSAIAMRDVELGIDPRGEIATDAAAEQRLDSEVELEAGAAGKGEAE